MKLKPLDDRIVFRLDAAESKSAGGIIFPTDERTNCGTVVSVGKNCTVKAGERIIFAPMTRLTSVELAGEKLSILRESEVLGVLM